MNVLSIDYKKNQLQQTKDGCTTMSQKLLRHYLRDLIVDNAIYQDGVYCLYFYQIPREEQKMLLSHVADVSEYEYALGSPSSMNALMDEYESVIQSKMDDMANDVYHESMHEAGLVLGQHNDNGEYYYR